MNTRQFPCLRGYPEDNTVFSRAISQADLPRHMYLDGQSPSFINIATPRRKNDGNCISYLEAKQMRCPKCRKTLEDDTMICPSCRTHIVASTSNDSPYAHILKPRSHISVKGLGSRVTGNSRVTATRHNITPLDRSDSSLKIRCMKCRTVNDNSDQYCRKCGSRINH